MCGRYVTPTLAEMERYWALTDEQTRNPLGQLFNASPTATVPMLRLESGHLELVPARWGLIPFWWEEDKPPRNTFNTRSEEAATKPMWRIPASKARCLVPALGWYEWVRHEVACVIVRRAPRDRTCRPIGSTLRGRAIR